MRVLDQPAKDLIALHSIGCVATIAADGAPAVSPKATFLVVDDGTLAFADIRSPGTVDNLKRDPRTEIDFIDPLHRIGYRVAGRALYRSFEDVTPALRERFRATWPDLFPLMHGVVTIDIQRVDRVTSPSYDVGGDRAQLADTWLHRFADALGYTVQRKT